MTDKSDRPHLSFWTRRIIQLRDMTANTREQAFRDADTPAGLYDACADGVENLQAVMALLRGRRDLGTLATGEAMTEFQRKILEAGEES